MPEYDAFGREIGENTLGGLGGDREPQPASVAAEPADGWSEAAARRPAAEPVIRPPGQELPIAPPPDRAAAAPRRSPSRGRPRSGGRRAQRRRGVGDFGCLFALDLQRP